MRRIHKSAEPAPLLAWKAGKNWQGNPPPWEELSAEATSAIRATTSADQHGLCCYCTGSIGNGAFHIEHFRPQETYEERRFAWPNLLASCEAYNEPFDGEPVKAQLHCGHRKGNWFEEGVTTDPQAAGVEVRFRYPFSGRIVPSKALGEADYKAVQKTIGELNLDSPALQRRRSALLTRAAQDAETLSQEGWLERYVEGADGVLPEFPSALRYNYEKHFAAKLEGK